MGRFAAELTDQAAQHRQPDHRAQHAQGRDPVARAGRLAGGGCGLRGARLQILEQDVDVRLEILRLHAWRRMAGAIEKELTKAWHFPAPIS
jgi:hypothetical protein